MMTEKELQEYVLHGVKRTGKFRSRGSYGSMVEEVMLNGTLCAGKKINEELMKIASFTPHKLEQLKALRHPNIVQFFGICFYEGCNVPVIVMELLEMNTEDWINSQGNEQIPLPLQASILRDIAKGLHYLHTHDPVIIHHNLTARNVLLTSSLHAKIADVVDIKDNNKKLFISTPYLPRECSFSPTEKVDIFSYGHLTLFVMIQEHVEILPVTIANPTNANTVSISEIELRSTSFSKLYHKYGADHDISMLVKRCLNSDPSMRPSAHEIVVVWNSIIDTVASITIDKNKVQADVSFSLDLVLAELKEVVEWKDVVVHLGVPKDVVDHIYSAYTGVEVQKREAISWWIKNTSRASWKELIDALLKANYPFLATRLMISRDADNKLSEESLKFCASVEQHLQKSGSVNRFLAHIVFVGLPGSGKSTLLARLLNLKGIDEMLAANESTGVMDGIITVNVTEDIASMHAANIDKNCEWHKVEFGLSCLRQMGIGCFVKAKQGPGNEHASQPEAMAEPQASTPVLEKRSKKPKKKLKLFKKKKRTYEDHRVAGMSEVEQIEKQSPQFIMANVQILLRREGFSAVRPFLENKSSLYLSDTGGQIEFQELLPLLVAGLAIFVFLFPLNVDLDACVTVSYRKKVGDKVQPTNIYTSSLTIKESFLQTLASIDSMEGSN